MANALELFARQTGSQLLADNDQWTNRVRIKSSSSSRTYIIARHKTNGTLGCSCPGWLAHRNCKHLRAFGPVIAAAKGR